MLSPFWAVTEPAPRLTVDTTASRSGVRPSAEETASRMEEDPELEGRPCRGEQGGPSVLSALSRVSLSRNPHKKRRVPWSLDPQPLSAVVARVMSLAAVSLWRSEPTPQTSVMESLNGRLPLKNFFPPCKIFTA